jgi:predicted porin
MKKSLLALAVAGAFSSAAFAQSSVTLFGIVDTNVGRLESDQAGGGSAKQTRVNNSGYNSSRLGVRGVEDLGGGLQAGFWLEGGIATDNGFSGSNSNSNNQASGAVTGNQGFHFARRSTVSLLGGFGELRLGRDYTPGFWNLTLFDPFGTNGVGTSGTSSNAGLQGNYSTAVRTSNTVGYFLPRNIGGVYGQVMWATGENLSTAANKKDGNLVGGRIGWAGGPVDVAVAFEKYDQLAAVAAGVSNANGEIQRINVGASFAFGPIKPMLIYNMQEIDSLQNNGAATGQERTDIEVGVIWTIGAGDVRAKYARNDVKGTSTGTAAGVGGTSIDENDGNMWALGYVHNLSRRTALYGTYARYTNKGAGTGFNVGIPVTQAGGKSSGFEAGIRHSF